MQRLISGLFLAAALLFSIGCKGDPATPQYWEKALGSAKSKKERLRVLDDLRKSPSLNASFAPMLNTQLGSEKQDEVKAAIARLLGQLKDPSSVQPLSDALDMGNTDSGGNAMNKEIAQALGAIGDPRSTPTLMKMLRAKDPYVRIEAINALGALKAKEAVDTLLGFATDESGEPFIAKKAIQALGEIGDPKSVSALIQMMFKERRGVSFYVDSSFALFQIGQPAADALQPILKGENKEMLEWAKKNSVIEPAMLAKSAQVLGDLHDVRAEKPLLAKLNFQSEFADVRLFVRMRMADALGRLRSKEAAKTLATMLDEEEATARQEYIRALTRIGGRDALPALVKSAGKGSWDAREPAVIGISMLGDERELPAFEKLLKDEEGLTTAECKENPDYTGCNAPAELVTKHVNTLKVHQKRLEAAKECKTDVACWAKKLDDADQGVRERAAYEVGRSGKAEYASELVKRLTEKNLDSRLAMIQGLDWLIDDSKEAAQSARAALQAIEKQINEERNKTEFVKVNEDLRRLAVKLRRNQA